MFVVNLQGNVYKLEGIINNQILGVKGSETITACSDEGLMLETSALGGHLTLSTRLSCYTPSLTQPHSLVKNFSPLNVDKEKFISSL